MTNKALAKLYTVPQTKDLKDTTNKRELEELFYKTGDPVFAKVVNIRSYDTVINNYIPNWKPANDGAVHTTWGFSAASGQLDSRAPNILNLSKHTRTGQRFRRIINAPPGYCFVECDKKSFHVGTLGYLACDPSYIRFSQLDPHSIFTSYIMPSDWGPPISFNDSDESILEQCREIKKRCKLEAKQGGIDLRQATAKPCVLGNQLGLGPHKLYNQNRRSIGSIERAKELQGVLASLFDKVTGWKDAIIEIAADQTYLLDEWGHCQFFYEVFRWERDKFRQWVRKRTNEAEQVLAFRVQGTAFGMLKYEHLIIEANGWNEQYNFINSIHDSLVFMPLLAQRDRCIADVTGIMNSPCPVLKNEATGPGGLLIRVEVSTGTNLQDYNESTNVSGMKEI